MHESNEMPSNPLCAGSSAGVGPKILEQVGALPFRSPFGGPAEVMLITSRETGRWVIPKGWPMEGRSGPSAALQEAYEEAGIRGTISGMPIGTYRYGKRLRRNRIVQCRVEVFPMSVVELVDDWPERAERQLQWFSPGAAAELVHEGDLALLIKQIEDYRM